MLRKKYFTTTQIRKFNYFKTARNAFRWGEAVLKRNPEWFDF